MSEQACGHERQNMKWEPDQIVHTCRICHEVWYTPRPPAQ